MTEQPFNLTTLEPWHEVNSILRRMKSLTVNAGGKEYDGDAVLSVDDEGGVVLFIPRTQAAPEVLKGGRPKVGGAFADMKAVLGMKKGKAHAVKARA